MAMPTAALSASLNEEQKQNWVEWYRKTFSSELGLLESESVVLEALNSASQENKSVQNSTGNSEAEQLRRRLKAVDALESLAEEVDCRAGPVPRRLWEPDAPVCRSCNCNLGWTRLKRRHHCRYCGLTFCEDCAPGEEGSARRCLCCGLRNRRFEALRELRTLEREVLQDCTKDGVASVARAYRKTIQLFTADSSAVVAARHLVHPMLDEESSRRFLQRARNVLMEGLHSFLELAEAKACFRADPSAQT